MAIFVNNKKVKTFNFSGGECYVSVNPSTITENTEILAKLYSSDAVMQLLMTVDAVRQVNSDTKIHLTIPYFPYARQDRVCNEGESFSLKIMASLINNLNCQLVTIYDPHSQVTIDMLNNSKIISLLDIVCNSVLADKIKRENISIVSPDKGATSKVQLVGKMIGEDVICASKVRDTKTGNIVATEVYGDVFGKKCILLDDICDGGRTFIELAKVLRNKGAEQIYLYVTHGIFSKGLDVLKQYFDHIYCYQTVGNQQLDNSNFLTILENDSSINQ